MAPRLLSLKGWTPDGMVGIVTGAGSGIGRALTTALRAGGATVHGTDLSGSAGVSVLDVTDRAAVAAAVEAVVAEHGRIDFICNNAGIAIGGDTEDISGEHWDRIVDINVGGVINGVLAAYPQMVRQGHGRIISTASLAGIGPAPLLTPYSMTKHAVVGMSHSLRIEARVHGVGVHVICPGVIETPLLDTRGPADLPDVMGGYDFRRYLTSLTGRPMPADRLAAYVLAGINKDHATIVAPASARAVWRLGRLSPGLLERATRSRVAAERKHSRR